MEIFAGLGAIATLFLIFVAILWMLLPFAVFGVKDLAKELIAEQKKSSELQSLNNKLIEQLIAQSVKAQ